jgi:hypothetical protein
MTVNTPWVQSIVSSIRARDFYIDSIPLQGGLNLQVLQRMTDLPRCQKHHFAAFVVEPPLLVVWDDDPNKIIKRIERLEADIVSLVWKTEMEDDDEEPPSDTKEYYGDEEEGETTEVRPVRLTRATMVGMSLALALVCLGLGWRALALEIMLDGYYLRLLLLLASPIQLFVSLVGRPQPVLPTFSHCIA